MKKFYLLSTQHLEDGLWFRDEDDFRVAMNYVAIQAALCRDVTILAFILMSNHVHFVLKCKCKAEAEEYMNLFKSRYSIYYQKKYGVKELLRRNGLDVREIPNDDEAVEKVIAYVLMNSVAANICAFCNQYAWGCGNLFFNPSKLKGTRLGDLSVRLRIRMLHCKIDSLPEDWVVSPDGYILPENYADVSGVEQLFRSPQRFNYFLRSSSKAKKRLESGDNLPAFRDQSILHVLSDLCRSLFRKESFAELKAEEQSELARQIRFRFSADANQIARVCGVSYADAARLQEET